MKKVLITMVLALSLFYSCKDSNDKSNPSKEKSDSVVNDVIKVEPETEIKPDSSEIEITITEVSSSVNKPYVKTLFQFDTTKFILIPANIKNGDLKTYEFLERELTEGLITKNERLEFLNYDFAKDYFELNKQSDIMVINKNQSVVDTLRLQTFGKYSAGTESYFVAVFSVLEPEHYDGKTAIANSATLSNPSPELHSNSILPTVFKENGKTDVYHYCKFQSSNKQFEIVSLMDWKNYRSGTFLIVDNELIDSLTNSDYLISGMQPIPMATDTSYTYLCDFFIPETCALWKDAMLIDFKNLKLRTL